MTEFVVPASSVNSRLSGLHRETRAGRLERLELEGGAAGAALRRIEEGLPAAQSELMTENVIGVFGVPLSVATNFKVDGKDVLVPMAIEEPSVVAAASKAAGMARSAGGFHTETAGNVMICQILLTGVAEPEAVRARILDLAPQLLSDLPISASVASAGGGPRGLEIRSLPEAPTGPLLVVHLTYDVGDAMGANIVNTAGEALAGALAERIDGEIVASILSNLAEERLATAQTLIPWKSLGPHPDAAYERMLNIRCADAWALADPYRAATHNKGILNGIGALALATGNDWRSVEAGAHAWAARSGAYQGLTRWLPLESQGDWPEPWRNDPRTVQEEGLALHGTITLPIALGTVGGGPSAHPVARGALELMERPSARRLAGIAAALGLAQNLAALRALTQEGIQSGHMRLHARQTALTAGVPPEKVQEVASRMARDRTINVEAARALWRRLQKQEGQDG